METLKSIFKFYINGSIHVALAICTLVKITFIKFDIVGSNIFLGFIFFCSIVGYNFVKYSKVTKLYHPRLTRSMKGIRLLTAVSIGLLLYFTFKIPYITLLYMLPLVFLTILYAVPVFSNAKNLRSIAGVKIFIISVVWSGTTVLIPIVYANASLDFDFIIEIIQRFLFIIVMMLPFEIRDLEHDDETLETVPQKIGVTQTKVFGSILLVVFLLLTAVKDELSSTEILSTIGITTISLLFLWGTEKKQSEYYCSFWVESVPMMWLGLYMLMQNLFG